MESIPNYTQPPIIISDDVVNYWADRYMEDRLIECGLPFTVYFDNVINHYPPLPWLDASAVIRREIVPELQAVVEFLGTDELGEHDEAFAQAKDIACEELHIIQAELDCNTAITYRDGYYFEPLHHHTRNPHNKSAYFKPKEGLS